jgi:hypothetical protein
LSALFLNGDGVLDRLRENWSQKQGQVFEPLFIVIFKTFTAVQISNCSKVEHELTV